MKLHALHTAQVEALKEVKGLMENIRSAWKQVPALVPGAPAETKVSSKTSQRTAA